MLHRVGVARGKAEVIMEARPTQRCGEMAAPGLPSQSSGVLAARPGASLRRLVAFPEGKLRSKDFHIARKRK